MGDLVFWCIVSLVAVLLAAGLLALTVQRFGHQVSSLVEPTLFKRISDVHALDAIQRRTLLRMAQHQGLPRPEVFFLSPRTLEAGLTRLRTSDPKAFRALQGIRERLFGEPTRA